MDNRAALVVLMAAAALLLLSSEVPADDVDDDPTYEPPDIFDAAVSVAQEAQEMFSTESDEVKIQNLQAFLWAIRVSEGTSGSNGYRTMVGGSLFDGYADHPRRKVWIENIKDYSSAAGAYQILQRTWDGVAGKLGLPDFSPTSQDAAAVELIRQRGALADVRAGRFAVAMNKCRKEWASLPGAGYGQHENTLIALQNAYTNAGGQLA